MARPIMRRLSPLVLAPLFALLFVLWAPPPSSNAQESPSVRLTLLSQTSWNCPTATADLPSEQPGWSCLPGRELDLRFRAQNLGTEPLTDLAIGVTLYSRVLTRSAYEDSLVSDPSIVIDAGTADEQGFEVGDTVQVSTLQPKRPFELVGVASSVYREEGCDGLVALGGGNFLGIAQAANVTIGMKHNGARHHRAGQTAAPHFVNAAHAAETELSQAVFQCTCRGDASHWEVREFVGS